MSIEELQQEGILQGQMALHPTDREKAGIYRGEDAWAGGFWRPRCSLLDWHSKRRFPLLNRDGDTVGKALVCSRCWKVLATDD